MSHNRNKREIRVRAGAAVSDVLALLEEAPDDDIEKGLNLAGNEVADPPESEIPDTTLFIPITKINEATREVWGRAAQEVPDLTKEILDYGSSRPLFRAWSEETFKRSGGKSKGNIREMHNPIAAGKLIDLQMKDAEKAFDIGTKIIDDQAWEKCLEGVYTGFSIGGKYIKRWPDPGNPSLMRYTAKPTEISLVDAPAIPTAIFDVVKAAGFELVKPDGSSEVRKFQFGAIYEGAEAPGVEKALPTQPVTGTKTTAVDTPLVMQPAVPPPVKLDANNMAMSGDKFAAATAPNVQDASSQVASDPNLPTPQLNADLGNGPAAVLAAASDKGAARQALSTGADGAAGGCKCACAGCAAGNHCSGSSCVAAKVEEPEITSATLELIGKQIGINQRGVVENIPPLFDWKQYGDPANIKWLVTKSRVSNTLERYNGGENRNQYSAQEWAVLGRRLKRLAEAVSPGVLYRYDPTKRRVEVKKENGMPPQTLKDALASARTLMQTGTPDAMDQAAAVMDTILDQVSTAPTMPSSPLGDTGAVNTPASTKPTQQPQANGGSLTPQTGGGVTPTTQPTAQVTAPSADKAADQTPPNSSPGVSTTGDNSSSPSSTDPKKPTSSVPATAAKGTDMPTDPLFATNPPASISSGEAPYMALIDGGAWMEKELPKFVSALADTPGRYAYESAMKIAGSEQSFSALYQTAMRRLLTAGGFTTQNLEAHVPELARKMQFGWGLVENDDVRKGINAAFAPNIYLQRLIKLMLPVATLLRSRFPLQSAPIGGTTAQWRAQLGYTKFLSATAMATAEADITIGTTGGTGQVINESALSFAAPFVFTADSNVVTLGAIAAQRGYDDPMQIAIIQSLVALLRTEEMNVLFGNSAALGAVGTVTATPQSTGGSLASFNYTAKVTALTGRGWRYTQEVPSYIGAGTYTVVTSNDTVTAGETANTAATLQAVTGPNGSLQLSWAAVPGAVAYNVYCLSSNGAVERYIATVTTTGGGATLAYTITAFPGSGNAAPTSGTTANTLGYEGLFSWCGLSTIYSQAIPNKSVIDQGGKALTLVGNNSIGEFDTILKNLWVNWQIAPTGIVCSPQAALHAAKIIGSATNPPQRIELAGMQGGMVGGVFATGYVNKFAPYMPNIPRVIDIIAHPYMADGSYMFMSEAINYQMAREGRGFMLETLIPYTYFPLGPTAPNYPFTTLVQETLECFHPGAQALIQGVNVA